MTRAVSGKGISALSVIAVMLLLSGLFRLGATGMALAADADLPPPTGTDGQICEPGAGALAMIDAAKAREADLNAREVRLIDREKAVDVAYGEIEKRLADLTAAEDALARTVSIADAAAEKDIARLVAMYENMKPKDAAPLFAEMAPEFAAGFLARMRPDAAAAILAGIDPKQAYTVSAVLAGRNTAAPTE